jgi:hypothetical protein
MGQNGAVVGQVLHLAHFPWKKSAKGVSKRVKNRISLYLLFKTQDDLVSYKEVLLSCFGM